MAARRWARWVSLHPDRPMLGSTTDCLAVTACVLQTAHRTSRCGEFVRAGLDRHEVFLSSSPFETAEAVWGEEASRGFKDRVGATDAKLSTRTSLSPIQRCKCNRRASESLTRHVPCCRLRNQDRFEAFKNAEGCIGNGALGGVVSITASSPKADRDTAGRKKSTSPWARRGRPQLAEISGGQVN